MTGKQLSLFKQIVNRKGWTFSEVAQRWGISERQMSRIANSGNPKDIDAANGLPDKLESNMNELANYLGVSDQQLEHLDIELLPDDGSSGEMVYSYYFYVPDDTPADILDLTGWKPGQLINGIPTHIHDRDD